MKRKIFIMEIPPSVNAAYQWSGSTRRPRQSKERKNYIEYVKMMQLAEHIEKIDGDVEIIVDVFPGKDNRDIDNIYKCLYDALHKSGIIDDDKHVRLQRGRIQQSGKEYGHGVIVVEIKQIIHNPVSLVDRIAALEKIGFTKLIGLSTLPDKTRKQIEQDIKNSK